VVLYKDSSNYAPRMKRGPTRGLIDFKKEIFKNLLVKIHKA
jgi:hypothetical protein